MNLKAENCPAHTYEPATGYQTVNNNEQQWQSASDPFSQRVLVYDSLDNNFVYSNDENYLLPATLGTYKHMTDIHHCCMPSSYIFTNNHSGHYFYRPVVSLSFFLLYSSHIRLCKFLILTNQITSPHVHIKLSPLFPLWFYIFFFIQYPLKYIIAGLVWALLKHPVTSPPPSSTVDSLRFRLVLNASSDVLWLQKLTKTFAKWTHRLWKNGRDGHAGSKLKDQKLSPNLAGYGNSSETCCWTLNTVRCTSAGKTTRKAVSDSSRATKWPNCGVNSNATREWITRNSAEPCDITTRLVFYCPSKANGSFINLDLKLPDGIQTIQISNTILRLCYYFYSMYR